MGWTGLALILLVIGSLLALRTVTVQTWLVGKVLERLSDESSGFGITIDRVFIDPVGPLRLKGALVKDLEGDTLFYVGRLDVDRWRVAPRRRTVDLGRVRIRSLRFGLRSDTGDVRSNLTRLLEHFASGDSTSSQGPWTIRCNAFDLKGVHFSYHDKDREELPHGVDFAHVDVLDGTVIGRDLLVIEDSVDAALDLLALRTTSGLQVMDLHGDVQVSGSGIRVKGLELRTDRSRVAGDIALLSGTWSDHAEFVTKIQLLGDLDSSLVDSRDIAQFASELKDVDRAVRVSGKVRGTVADLKCRELVIDYGSRSRLIGSVDLSGLPDIDNTFMLIDLQELTTSIPDLRSIPMAPFGTEARLEVPDELVALAPFSFSGNFTGFVNDFTAYGKVRSGIGELNMDVSFGRDGRSGHIRSKGQLATDGFDLGRLLGDATLGAIACDLRIDLSGRDLTDMEGDLEGSIPFIELNGKRVANILASGHLERRLFQGTLTCDDPSVRFSFDGLADLQGTWPLVDFSADVGRIDLFELGILPEQHLGELSFQVVAAGELAPDSLKGAIDLRSIAYCDDRGIHELGDVELSSHREGSEQVLRLRSDMANASVTGDFLPTRLPEAFKNIVFSVFPSLQEQVDYAMEPQQFDWELQFMHMEPLLSALDIDLD
ncbi:MAG: hypothetical protein KDB88_05885, partial [Flavobacteriales bacterium]|nr:hypothetical protein [Flavobacteriales bacterium]